MRLFTKIFLCGTFVFGLAFLVSGYVMIRYSMDTGMEREKDFALRQYQYDKFTVQAGLLANRDSLEQLAEQETFSQQGEMEQLFGRLTEGVGVPAAFFSEEGTLLYSEIKGMDDSLLEELTWDQSQILADGMGTYRNGYQFQKNGEGSYILTFGLLSYGQGNSLHWPAQSGKLFFVTRSDISDLVKQQETLVRYFKRCYCVVMAVGMVLLLALSVFLTRPLKRMAKAADRMAGGDYQERLPVSGKDEIGELAKSLNRMAEAVEENVEELSEAARQKEDFVANFAHELKTPLTSVIGYADMLYQKDLPREEAKKASWYIWNEGMRLEALSLKLMDLIVLNRQDFSLEEMPADELLKEVADSLHPLLAEKRVDFGLETESAYIRVDYDLFKTLLLNLADNSIKAGCSRINLSGKYDGNGYRICVRDNGRGIPREELSRITEAFYMVDKSRARKQHGAGLGLALADRIARIHGGRLVFESEQGKGTQVSFILPCEKGEENEEELG